MGDQLGPSHRVADTLATSTRASKVNTDLLAFRSKPPRDNAEETLQKAIVAHLRLRGTGALWFHVPNGEHRSKRTGARLKAMGVRAGVCDLVFCLPTGLFAAMELKAPGGRLSPAQKDFEAQCRKLGVPHAVVGDLNTAIDILLGWEVIR